MRIGVVDFGGQYNHLIYRRLRELGVQAEMFPPTLTLEEVESRYDGIVLSGGSFNIPDDIDKVGNAFEYAKKFSKPILGICLGHHIIAYSYGGELSKSNPEFGEVIVYVDDEDIILRGMGRSFIAWESHNVEVSRPPEEFQVLAHSDLVKVQAMRHISRPIFSVQFHPEVEHTENGIQVFKNFVEVCKR
ncbi:MAG: GMP synthase subunit A [Crenarchaeota archaeon]|nr:GMP synthase subunit A [Thermoproteota archaeon]